MRILWHLLTIIGVGVFVSAQTGDQNFTFPAGGEVFDVGQTITIKWNNLTTKYPSVTIVLWNPTADGVYFDLGSLDFIANSGSANWTVPSILGVHKFGIGNGPGGALMFTSESKLFTIRQPIVTTTRGQGISSSSSSSSSPSGSVRGSTSATAATTPVNVPVSNSSDTATPVRTLGFAGVSSGKSIFKDNASTATILLITMLSWLALQVI